MIVQGIVMKMKTITKTKFQQSFSDESAMIVFFIMMQKGRKNIWQQQNNCSKKKNIDDCMKLLTMKNLNLI